MANSDPSRLRGVFGLPFAEQEEFFKQKIHLPTARWDDIDQSAHDRAFIVAGAMKADLLADLHAAIIKAKSGGGQREFDKSFDEIVARHGWTGWTGEDTPGGRDWRTRVIYQTNLRVSHAAGRYRQLTESGIKYWMWKHNDLVRDPRPEHLAWTGLVLPADHPFWKLHFPPQIPPDFGCRCRVVGMERAEDAQRYVASPLTEPPAGWETIGTEFKDADRVAESWNFAPGAHAATPLAEMIEKKLFNLPAPIGAAMWENLAPALAMEQRLAWTSLVSEAAATLQAGNRAALAHVAAPATVADLATRGVPLATADIWLRDAELIHALRDAKHSRGAALTVAVWRDLPDLLKTARPYLDTLDAGIVYVFDAPEGLGKVALRVNYTSKVQAGGKRDKLTSNFIRTGGLIDPNNMGEARYIELKR